MPPSCSTAKTLLERESEHKAWTTRKEFGSCQRQLALEMKTTCLSLHQSPPLPHCSSAFRLAVLNCFLKLRLAVAFISPGSFLLSFHSQNPNVRPPPPRTSHTHTHPTPLSPCVFQAVGNDYRDHNGKRELAATGQNRVAGQASGTSPAGQ